MGISVNPVERARRPSRMQRAGNGGPAGWSGGGDGRPRRVPPDNSVLGISFAMTGILMLFMGLTSAYVVRRGIDPGWQPGRLDILLVVNTVVLLVSSITLEIGRRALRRGGAIEDSKDSRVSNGCFVATLVLGLCFLAGQLVVWRQLAEAGMYLSTTAHSSFFYLLTALHGLHLVGGLGALSWMIWMPAWHSAPAVQAYGPAVSLGRPDRRERWAGTVALYWHFMDALWLYLVILLFT
jgi:cytochrome c oxidase subunit III